MDSQKNKIDGLWLVKVFGYFAIAILVVIALVVVFYPKEQKPAGSSPTATTTEKPIAQFDNEKAARAELLARLSRPPTPTEVLTYWVETESFFSTRTTLHLDREVCEDVSNVMVYGAARLQVHHEGLFKDIREVKGVETVSCHGRYSLVIRLGELFEWKTVWPQISQVLEKRLGKLREVKKPRAVPSPVFFPQDQPVPPRNWHFL